MIDKLWVYQRGQDVGGIVLDVHGATVDETVHAKYCRELIDTRHASPDKNYVRVVDGMPVCEIAIGGITPHGIVEGVLRLTSDVAWVDNGLRPSGSGDVVVYEEGGGRKALMLMDADSWEDEKRGYVPIREATRILDFLVAINVTKSNAVKWPEVWPKKRKVK